MYMSESLTSPFNGYRAPSIHDVLNLEAIPGYQALIRNDETDMALHETHESIAHKIEHELRREDTLLQLISANGVYVYMHDRDSIPFATVFNDNQEEREFLVSAAMTGLHAVASELPEMILSQFDALPIVGTVDPNHPIHGRSLIVGFKLVTEATEPEN